MQLPEQAVKSIYFTTLFTVGDLMINYGPK